MRTFREIFLFEIRYQIRQPVFYIGAAIFFLMTFGAVTSDNIAIGGAIGSLNRNAPFVIMQLTMVGVLIAFPGFVLSALDSGPKGDPNKIRIEVPQAPEDEQIPQIEFK